MHALTILTNFDGILNFFMLFHSDFLLMESYTCLKSINSRCNGFLSRNDFLLIVLA